MFVAENEVIIHKPVEEVFAYATDPNRLSRWRPSVLEVIGYTPPVGVGATYELAEKLMGRRQQFGQRVTAHEPNRLQVVETTSGSVRPTQRFTFEPISDGRTRYAARLEVHTSGLMRLFEPLMRGKVRKTMGIYGENLKRNLENGI